MEETIKEKNEDDQNDTADLLREKIGAIAEDLKRLAEWEIECVEDEKSRSSGFQQKMKKAGRITEKVSKTATNTIRRYPLISGAVVFGLGFAIAVLIFKKSGKDQ